MIIFFFFFYILLWFYLYYPVLTETINRDIFGINTQYYLQQHALLVCMFILFLKVLCPQIFIERSSTPYLKFCLFSFKAPTCLDNINFTIDRWRRTKWRTIKWHAFSSLSLSVPLFFLSSESIATIRKFYRKPVKKIVHYFYKVFIKFR